MVKTETAIVYLDYSQIELRFQALYTYLIGKPDYNMCRAYMPYDCYMLSDMDNSKIEFNPEDKNHIKNYDKLIGYQKEDDKVWKPLDIHGATTKAAFPDVKETDPEFHDLRYIGKRVNFAKNYGAQLNRIKEMFPDMPEEQQVSLDRAYYKAFPGVKHYHEFCNERAALHSYTSNLFGVKYYNVSGHKLKNMLIQGSCAFFLKKKIIEINNYLKEKGYKTKMQLQLHAELSFEWYPKDGIEIFFEIKNIMENWSETKVPIIADMEVTTTNWAEKEEIKTEEELNDKINR